MLELTSEYRIDNKTHTDSLTLQRYTKVNVTVKLKPTGATRNDWRDIGYYSSIPEALKGFFREYTKEADDWKDLLKRITTVEKLIDSILDIDVRLQGTQEAYKAYEQDKKRKR